MNIFVNCDVRLNIQQLFVNRKLLNLSLFNKITA